MGLEIQHVVEALVMPPGHSVILWLLALWALLTGRLVGARLLAVLGVVSVVVFSLPLTAGAMLRSLQPAPLPPDAIEAFQPGAIVVLAGGRRAYAPEFGEGAETVSQHSLERARYGAWLAKKTGLPLLVTGGIVTKGEKPEAALIAEVMRDEFGVEVRWTETGSRTTAGNATRSAAMLAGSGISRVLLVTSAVHMPRAVAVFEHADLEVLPAPTAYVTGPEPDRELRDFIPSARGLAGSVAALHEYLGLLWYRIRGWA